MSSDSGSQGQLSAGLPDGAFVSDGLVTKRVLRAYALAMLAPRGGECLWDLGAGSGSIGIEWCLQHRGNRVFAVERDAERRALIDQNAAAHQVADQVRVVAAEVAAAIGGLPRPDAVFVGGAVSADVLTHCWDVLPAGGRLVAHSVTADSDTVLLEAYRRWGGELSRVGVETAEPIGRFTGFRPLRTVTSWAAIKN